MYKNFFFFFFFVIFFVSKTYSSEKIVVVDIQFLVDNSIAGKFLDKKIEKLDKANFDYFQKKEKNFAEKEKKIISQKNVLSDSEYQDKVKNFKEDLVKYNKEKRDKIENLKKTRDNLYKKLFEKINQILVSYSNTNNVTMVFDKKNLIMTKKDFDVTETILSLLNKELKKIE